MRSINIALLGVVALLSRTQLALAQSDSESTETTETGSTETGSTETASTDTESDGPENPTVVITATKDLDYYTGSRTEQVIRQTGPPTGSYASYGSRITLGNPEDETMTGSFTFSQTDFSETDSFTSTPTTVGNTTSTSTGVPRPTNTQPCNGHVELCSRKYSNVTNVGCHNSPFVRPGNSGSNQELTVKTQLNDGVRFLQAQIQYPEGGHVPHFCHTSCDLLDAGPITDWLTQVREWVEQHPFDVVTILLGNGNYSTPDFYAPYIEKTGILRYVYEAPYLPMARDDWPTLENMILRGKRVVMFMDYEARQEEYPWLLDEFSQMWETPFDPLDRDFPCDIQRPPGLSEEDARNRLYLMNHNLNVEFNVFDISLLVPAVSLLNVTNNATGYGSLGVAAEACREKFTRAPNVLNVDYYNYGDPPGSVFEVAAQMNNVTYNWDCCGSVKGGAVGGKLSLEQLSWTALVAMGVAVQILW